MPDERIGSDWSNVIDEALWPRYAQVQDAAMRDQFEAPDDVDPDEYTAWEVLRDAAAAELLREPEH
jgi:hypothetical protein